MEKSSKWKQSPTQNVFATSTLQFSTTKARQQGTPQKPAFRVAFSSALAFAVAVVVAVAVQLQL
jgi:hypothetical protein